jgi:hypothetical protein
MKIMHQRMLDRSKQTKEFSKAILQLQQVSKGLRDAQMRRSAQRIVFIETQGHIKMVLVRMETLLKEVANIVIDDDDFFTNGTIDEIDIFANAFELMGDLDMILKSFPKTQQDKIVATLGWKSIESGMMHLYNEFQTDYKYGPEYAFEITEVRSLVGRAVAKVEMLDTLYDRPKAKTAEAKPTRKNTIQTRRAKTP